MVKGVYCRGSRYIDARVNNIYIVSTYIDSGLNMVRGDIVEGVL